MDIIANRSLNLYVEYVFSCLMFVVNVVVVVVVVRNWTLDFMIP